MKIEKIQEHLNHPRERFQIESYAETESTNQLLAEKARAGAPPWTVIFAESQTNGRGRHQRHWHSPPNLGIWMSVLLRPALETRFLNALNLLCAVTWAEILDPLVRSARTDLQVGLKWPNDIWIGRRKVGGILLETAFTGQQLNYAIAGIGLNINHDETDFPPDLRNTATSLKISTGRTYSREALAGQFLNAFYHAFQSLLPENTAKVMNRYRNYLLFKNQPVSVWLNDHQQEGILRDIDEEGCLALEQNGIVHIIRTGELHRLRQHM